MPKRTDVIVAIGRRKSAIARIKLNAKTSGDLSITVNNRDLVNYFNYFEWQDIVLSPLKAVGQGSAHIEAVVTGGGYKAQAEALRLAIARAFVKIDESLKPTLRRMGFLTVDARVKERKKAGLKRARRAPQWSKR